jgi:hypothetical protein
VCAQLVRAAQQQALASLPCAWILAGAAVPPRLTPAAANRTTFVFM